MKKADYIRECKTYCKKYDTSYYFDVMYNMNDDMEKPKEIKEVCKHCIFNDTDFMTGCNYPYITG